jgi:hypothetical protein
MIGRKGYSLGEGEEKRKKKITRSESSRPWRAGQRCKLRLEIGLPACRSLLGLLFDLQQKKGRSRGLGKEYLHTRRERAGLSFFFFFLCGILTRPHTLSDILPTL